MKWYIIGRKTFYRTRLIFKITVIALLLIAFSVSVIEARYDKELYLAAANAPDESRLVVIDAGHGGEDCGAVGVTGALEKDLNLAVASELGAILAQHGYTVVYTRTEDKLLLGEGEDIKGIRKISDLKNRAAVANTYPSALFISIHMNSYSEAKYSGLQVYYAPGDEESRALAGKIQSSVKKQLQPENSRQTKAGKGIFVLENSEATAVLIECGFLTNPEECTKLSQKEYQKQLSSAIVCGIIEYKEGKN